MHGLKYVRPGNGFVPNFPLTQTTDVNGVHQHPLYTYLKVTKQSQTELHTIILLELRV